VIGRQPERILGVGVSMPGVVDSEAGVCKYVINIPLLQNAGLKSYMEKRFCYNVHVENDVRANLQGCASQKVDIQIAPATEGCALRGISGVAISESFDNILELVG